MKCNKCEGDAIVIDVRPVKNTSATRRRFECKFCGNRETRYSVPKEEFKKLMKIQRRIPDILRTLENLNMEEWY